ncbi:MAG: inner membrane protein [Patiriisocius sp.]|jgi:inner membrane protein
MASVFGHALTAIAFGSSFSKELRSTTFWILGIVCAILPDADVLGLQFNVPYERFWGHRGFSHSLLFSCVLGCLVTAIFYSKLFFTKSGVRLMVFFTICTASHAVLDGMTSGGLGLAFFSPFDDTRYFLPWRPIQVSPIGIDKFMGEWVRRVLLNEAIWIGIPAILYMLGATLIKKYTS